MNSLTFQHATLHRQRSGFTLLELMFGLCAVGLVLAIGMPAYRNTVERQQVAQAIRDLGVIAQQLERYKTTHSFRLPMTLAELGNVPKDPWGRDYRYLNFADPAPATTGMMRKDHNMHPLNSAFDLYSIGRDGLTRPALTAKDSRDDVVYGRDGSFIGRASDF